MVGIVSIVEIVSRKYIEFHGQTAPRAVISRNGRVRIITDERLDNIIHWCNRRAYRATLELLSRVWLTSGLFLLEESAKVSSLSFIINIPIRERSVCSR